MTKKFYTVSQLGEYLGKDIVSKGTIYLMIKRGEIPASYIGTKPLIPAWWVDDFINSAEQISVKAL